MSIRRSVGLGGERCGGVYCPTVITKTNVVPEKGGWGQICYLEYTEKCIPVF